MAEIAHVYRAKYKGKFFWFVSRLEDPQRALRMRISFMRSQSRVANINTEIQNLVVQENFDFSQIEVKRIDSSDSLLEQAKITVEDLSHFSNDQIYGQRCYILAFYLKDCVANDDKIIGNYQVAELVVLMQKYPKIDFGFLKTKESFLAEAQKSDIRYYYHWRSMVCRYWLKDDQYLQIIEQNSLNRKRSAGWDLQVYANYDEAFRKLENNNKINEIWYRNSEEPGLAWYLTDLNSMTNILSNLRLDAEICGQGDNLITIKNVDSIKQYLRFSLKPQATALVNMPVFLCFNLRRVLQRGGLLTKQKLEEKTEFSKVIDSDLSYFKNSVANFYSTITQPDVIIEDHLNFYPEDVSQIYVRTPIEKIVLLKMVSKCIATSNLNKKVDIDKYAKKITVRPSLFKDSGNAIQKEMQTLLNLLG